jgi:hypothetical protein
MMGHRLPRAGPTEYPLRKRLRSATMGLYRNCLPPTNSRRITGIDEEECVRTEAEVGLPTYVAVGTP